MKWFIQTNKIVVHKGYFMFIPSISIWYDKYRYPETGLYTPSFGITIGWVNLTYSLIFQKSY